MLSLLPGRLFPQLFAWLVLIHISGLRINVSFNILEISSTSLPFQKKEKISPIHPSASVSIATAMVQNLISSGLDCSLLSILACWSLPPTLFSMLLPDLFLTKHSCRVVCLLWNLQYCPTANRIKSEHVSQAFKALHGPAPLTFLASSLSTSTHTPYDLACGPQPL